jgi:quercetin dioxygenase-like cupin family protein
MNRRHGVLGLTLGMGLLMGACAVGWLHAQTQLQRTTLVHADMASIAGKEVDAWIVEFPPGAETGKHFHHADQFVYVLEGTIILEEEGKPPVTYKAGQMFHELPNMQHTGRNGSTTAPLKVLAFQVHDKGQPLLVPVK